MAKYKIAWMPGDGVGNDVMEAAKIVLEAIKFDAEYIPAEIGWEFWKTEANPLPDRTLKLLPTTDCALFGAITSKPKEEAENELIPELRGKGHVYSSPIVGLRQKFNLHTNLRPCRAYPGNPLNYRDNIDLVVFRENTEGAYVLGGQGVTVDDDLTIDFKVITAQGAERIIRLAFEYARKNKINRVTLVTKANVVKTTDGKFLEVGYKIAEEYPEISCDDWYIDIMTAKLVDPKRRTPFRVLALPNLYGDILTDEAAEFQGGVGTAGSANIGKRYAMFEAIHGSAPRMVTEGRAQYADPASMMRAAAMLLNHIGHEDKGRKLEMALDICGLLEKKKILTGRSDGVTGKEYSEYLMETIEQPDLERKWQNFQG